MQTLLAGGTGFIGRHIPDQHIPDQHIPHQLVAGGPMGTALVQELWSGSYAPGS